MLKQILILKKEVGITKLTSSLEDYIEAIYNIISQITRLLLYLEIVKYELLYNSVVLKIIFLIIIHFSFAAEP